MQLTPLSSKAIVFNHFYIGVLSYVVWKTKNVYLGIIIHCTINLLGAIGGYMAVSEGLVLGR